MKTEQMFLVSFDDDSNDASNTSGTFWFSFLHQTSHISSSVDVRSPAPTTESKPPARVLSKIPSTRSFDEDNGDADGDAAGATTKTPPAPKKSRITLLSAQVLDGQRIAF